MMSGNLRIEGQHDLVMTAHLQWLERRREKLTARTSANHVLSCSESSISTPEVRQLAKMFEKYRSFISHAYRHLQT